jgi:outer membrane protein assembly factor BamB
MKKQKITTGLICLAIWSFLALSAQESIPGWTHFRGSDLNGISPEKELPLTWSDSLNVAWKTAIEGRGWSSPVVYGEQVWMTSATIDGKELSVICVDFASGDIIYNQVLFYPDTVYRKHAINSYATPTPAIEAGYVYVHFGRYGTACLDTKTGKKIWERTDMQCEHIQGPGSSLLIYKEKLIVHMEGSDQQYIVALDKRSGETIWRTERPKAIYDKLGYIGKKAYITPIIVKVNGRDLMISNGAAVCIAYDPENGKEVWRIIQGEDSTISMPVAYNGLVYFYTGFVTDAEGEKYAELLAVDPVGEGDIASTNIKWRLKSPILQLQSPLIYDGLLYTVDSKALLSCLDAGSGESIWTKQLKGKFHSSPVYADGHVYINSTRGETYVVKAGKEFEMVAENKLDGEIWTSPAITGSAILMRTSKSLYKLSSR